MIHDEICTYEVCKLAKEKGFDLYCFPFYAVEDFTAKYVDNVGEFYKFYFEKGDLYINYSVRSLLCKDKILPAPTQSILQRWLREEKGIYIEVYIDWGDSIEYNMVRYSWRVATIYRVGNHDIGGYDKNESELYFDTYELALEDALKYALENLA